MVKFAKQLEGSLVPEWKDAYCNYKELKRDVNRIKQDRRLLQISDSAGGVLRPGSRSSQDHTSLLQGSHLKRTTHRILNPLGRASDHDQMQGHTNSLDWNVDDEACVGVYETGILMGSVVDPAEQDRIFFTHLDVELEKINHFYKAKEAEYVSRAIRLENQLLALFRVQEALARHNLKMRTSSFNTAHPYHNNNTQSPHDSFESPLLEVITVRHDDDDSRLHKWNVTMVTEESSKPLVLLCEEEQSSSPSSLSSTRSSTDEEMEIIANFIESVNVSSDRSARDVDECNYNSISEDHKCDHGHNSSPNSSECSSPWSSSRSSSTVDSTRSSGHASGDASPLEMVQKKGEFNARLRHARETVEHQAVRRHSRQQHKSIIQDMIDMSLGKKKVQSSEKMLRTAFVEFYRGLGLLKSYSSLNMVAFAKIMKKYDKVGRHRFGPLYIREVEHSYFATSDKVAKLMTKVEEIFTKHFADHDRQKAMAQLRPMHQHGGHSITFLLGIFSGASVALMGGFLVLLTSTWEYRTLGGHNYMDTVFRVFSTLGLVLLHMYMYGLNVLAWQRARINYPFIFEFAPGTELWYREVFLVCTAFTSLLLGTMIVHIIASTKEVQHYYTSEFAPLGITLLFLIALCTPMNVLYRSARMCFLRCFQHIICAPFYKVVLADFFLGDQLTSQVAAFRNVEFMLCYYTGGYFQEQQEDACTHNKMFKAMMYVFSLLPYWFRFLQCLRRWQDEGDKMQLYNAGKYASAMLAMVIKVTYSFRGDSSTWLVLFILFSSLATFYQLYWDLVVDWGLLQHSSRNPWLRDNLILKKKYVYFVSMGVNVVLRLAWVSSIQHVNSLPGFSQAGWDTIFASLEVIRRGHWNFYRLENEHLNNVGKFRAVKTVPLPFKEFVGDY